MLSWLPQFTYVLRCLWFWKLCRGRYGCDVSCRGCGVSFLGHCVGIQNVCKLVCPYWRLGYLRRSYDRCSGSPLVLPRILHGCGSVGDGENSLAVVMRFADGWGDRCLLSVSNYALSRTFVNNCSQMVSLLGRKQSVGRYVWFFS